MYINITGMFCIHGGPEGHRESEEGFEFLGFRFIRQYSAWKKKRGTRWFPSPKSELKIRERTHELTNNRALSTTPEEAREILIPILRGWGNYFAHSLASSTFNGIWDYAQCRLMYMYCRQHNKPSTWKNSSIEKLGLFIIDTKPFTFTGKRHKAISLKQSVSAMRENCSLRSTRGLCVMAELYSIRNKEHLKTAIYFRCGNLDIYP